MNFNKDELEDIWDMSLPIWPGPNGILVASRGYPRRTDSESGSTAMLDTDDGEDEDSAEIARRHYVAYLQRKALGA